jgi:hypothetical protein
VLHPSPTFEGGAIASTSSADGVGGKYSVSEVQVWQYGQRIGNGLGWVPIRVGAVEAKRCGILPGAS